MKGKIRLFMVLSLGILFSAAMFLSQCGDKNKGLAADKRGAAYANPQTCVNCHKDVYNAYSHNGHFHTSSPINGNSLQAGLAIDTNVFVFNDSVKIAVNKQNDGLYQAAYFHDKKVNAKRFDIAFGSGEKAQTYGYWKGKQLFELPLSYFREIHNWANSPGFPANLVYYNRPIVSRCFECHASYADKQFVQSGALAVSEEYDKTSIIYGIDCQRCHGPAADHVNYQISNPTDKTGKFIAHYSRLNRQQKVEMCAVCHGGSDSRTIRSTFQYKPGDKLINFYEPDFGMVNNNPDVHGNQTGLLNQSKCFANSPVLTCTTCHDPHQKENNNLVAFSQKCMNCHSEASHNFCKMAPQLGAAINTKCIDCHMPAMPSKVITYKQTASKTASGYYLHTHRIAVYPEKAKEIIAFLKNTAPGITAR